MARTLTSTARVVEVLESLLADPRVSVTFTVESAHPSAFVDGAEEYLRRLGVRVVSWVSAADDQFDLAVAAHHSGDLHVLRCPIVVLPHGPSFGKATAMPSDVTASLLSATEKGRPAATIVASHASEASALFGRADVKVEICGDPVLDRLTASIQNREALRAGFGVREGQRLVVLSSTEVFLTQRDSCWVDSDSSWGLLAGCCW